MPRGDRTGPWGQGPITGRSMGFGRGGGRGWRHMYYATGQPGRAGWGFDIPNMSQQVPAYGMPYVGNMTAEQEITTLKQQADYFTKALDEIKKHIQELESDKERG
ncbi:MAG: hypothetical protein A2161_04170 [Candidatus Schekmanbacteria bacterium RBG_13_48_7]|uniref:DUF5320 domain-containing protein n=1 Tax=Candidatus Schekmanbacteria bacterium RBG_13_48_7 TaxID=1817878 RepID=A0A1F7RNS5_9BACT|nr:MAG: hypothetical protein A2161_04170 [Candidatus Schekmanbacteria bacterium RBG_13_48_7]